MSNFKQRINKIDKIIQAETEGEYALQPLENSFVRLFYKGKSVLDFCVIGKTERGVYNDTNTLVKFYLLKQIVDIESTLNNC